jgi:hypothetical protein
VMAFDHDDPVEGTPTCTIIDNHTGHTLPLAAQNEHHGPLIYGRSFRHYTWMYYPEMGDPLEVTATVTLPNVPERHCWSATKSYGEYGSAAPGSKVNETKLPCPSSPQAARQAEFEVSMQTGHYRENLHGKRVGPSELGDCRECKVDLQVEWTGPGTATVGTVW